MFLEEYPDAEKVATDNLTGYEWYFLAADDDSLGWYVQTKAGEEISRLTSKNFPNPNDVWEKKMRKSSDVVLRELTIEERERLKPRQYIFDIWAHKSGE